MTKPDRKTALTTGIFGVASLFCIGGIAAAASESKFDPLDAKDWMRLLIAWLPPFWGLALIILILLVWGGWWLWKNRADIIELASSFRRSKPLPTADPKRFSVGLAHLQDDKDRAVERELREALINFAAKLDLEPLEFDRTIYLRGQPEDAEEAGHKEARKFLKESGAQVLVWGRVAGASSARLFWTSAAGGRHSERAYQPQAFELPDVHGRDLADILGLVVATQSAEFFAQEGRFIADQLSPFIGRVRRLAEAPIARHWNSDTRARVAFALANAFNTYGEQTGKNESLAEAVAFYRQTLLFWTRERVPLDWAGTQNNLGNALARLGERESGTTRLEEAVTAYRAALEEWTRERVPLLWATTQNNLGNALQRLGERESGISRLEEAVTAYRAALEERTRERVPLDWAATQNNLGSALQRLGERESGTSRLEEAVTAYQAALEEWTRERVPLDWAAAQNNLGNALRNLGERESGTTRLKEAVTAYRAALEDGPASGSRWIGRRRKTTSATRCKASASAWKILPQFAMRSIVTSRVGKSSVQAAHLVTLRLPRDKPESTSPLSGT